MLDSVASTSGKFTSKFRRDRGPPPVPEKDPYLSKPPLPYASSSYSQSTASISTSSIAQSLAPSTSTNGGLSPPSNSHPSSSSRSMKSFKRAIAKLPGIKLSKRPSFASLASHTAPNDQPEGEVSEYGDDEISLPFNISHDLHVEPKEDGLAGLPSSWSSALTKAGFTDDEIHAMYTRQGKLPSFSTPPISPNTFGSSSKPWSRAAQSLPRSVSPSSGRPYSPMSSGQSTFTYAPSEFPSELDSIRLRKDTLEGSVERTPPKSSTPLRPPPLVPPLPSLPPSTSLDTQTIASSDLPNNRVTAPVFIHSSSSDDHGDNSSDGSSEEDGTEESSGQARDFLSLDASITRTSISPPRLFLGTETADEDDWTQSLLSSLGTSSFSDLTSDPSTPTEQRLKNFEPALPSPASDHRRDTIIAPTQLLSSRPPIGGLPSPSLLAEPVSGSRSSTSSQSKSDASSSSSVMSRESIASLQEADFVTPVVVRRVSVAGRAHAVALNARLANSKAFTQPAAGAPVVAGRDVRVRLNSSTSNLGEESPISTSGLAARVASPVATASRVTSSSSSSPMSQRSSQSKAEDEESISTPTSFQHTSEVYADDSYVEAGERPSSLRGQPEVKIDAPRAEATPSDHRSSLSHVIVKPKLTALTVPPPSSTLPTLSPSPTAISPQFTSAGSIRGERSRPPSPLGTQAYEITITTPLTPARTSSLDPDRNQDTRRANTLSAYNSPISGQRSPHDKDLPPVPPKGGDRKDIPIQSGNGHLSLLPEERSARGDISPIIDGYSYELGDKDDTNARRLFGPLVPYLSATDPFTRFSELTQVAEGQFGPVYAARATDADAGSESSSGSASKFGSLVAVKLIRVQEERSPKVQALASEMGVMDKVRHEHVLATVGLFVHVDTLWVEMELMERSLADMLPLVEEGLTIAEPEVARFASDVLSGLAYLEELHIAHRDVRSDNLLLSRAGVLKLADFSHAVVTQPKILCTTSVPIPPYWMAPEMRLGRPYNPHLVDIWSVGATIWEIIEGSPPFLEVEDPRDFGDRWPALRRANEFSVGLHQFLRLCSELDDWRPHADELLKTTFVNGACPRNDIVTLLAEVRLLEDGMNDQ